MSHILQTLRSILPRMVRHVVPRGLLHLVERVFQVSIMSERSSPEKWREVLGRHVGIALHDECLAASGYRAARVVGPQAVLTAEARRLYSSALLQAALQEIGYVVVDRSAEDAESQLVAELEQRGALVLREKQLAMLISSGQDAVEGKAKDRYEDEALLRFMLSGLTKVVGHVRGGSDQWRQLVSGLPESLPAQFIDTAVEAVLGSTHKSLFWGDRMLTLDKACSFRNDEAFMRAWRSVHATHAYDQYASPDGIAWRMHVLCWAARRGLGLEGDFVECGVFKGDMSLVVIQSTDFAASGKTFYLYDTFSGFSPKYSSPDDFPMNEGFFDYANQVYSRPGMYESVVERFALYENVRVVRGALPDSLDQACPEKIAYLHVDLNSPAAEIGTLLRLFDRVEPGGVVVFDDYGWLEYIRQREAEDAFMAARGYTILELPTGQGLVVKCSS